MVLLMRQVRQPKRKRRGWANGFAEAAESVCFSSPGLVKKTESTNRSREHFSVRGWASVDLTMISDVVRWQSAYHDLGVEGEVNGRLGTT